VPTEESDYSALPQRPALPSTIVLETTIKCNLRCDNGVCNPNNEPGLLTRDASHLDAHRFKELVDELRGSLSTVYFYNYGEPFMHPQAEDMLLYLRGACPDAQIVTSTNGIPLAKPHRAKKVVDSQIDAMTFTISGVRQETYERYHARGQVGLALQGLQNICEIRDQAARPKPQVIWRYLVFRWNDTERELDAAIALSKLYRVNQFALYVTHIPQSARSYRLAPGSLLFDKYRKYISFAGGYSCVMPDANGFYPRENLPELGPARWSCWRAMTRRRPRGDHVVLALSINRAPRASPEPYCIVRTPWTALRVSLRPHHWTNVSIPVPEDLRTEDAFDIEVISEHAWFPIEETKSPDLRCLGVLVQDETDFACKDSDPRRDQEGTRVLTPAEREHLEAYGPRTPLPQFCNNSARFTFA
jgi:MoaA/NifB/PqqE/SkfB family radical SAM enzyme